MIRRLTLAGLLVFAAQFASAEVVDDVTQAKLWDADSATFTYCNEIGRSGSATGGVARGADYVTPRVPAFKVKTSGSSTTITSNTASSSALKFVSVGDIISFAIDGKRVERAVITNADDDTITVDEAIDLTGGYFYSWRSLSCGTAGTSGEIPVRDLKFFQLTVQLAQADTDTDVTNVTIECRHLYGPFLVVEEKAIADADAGTGVDAFLTRFFHEERWEACRVGVQVPDDDGTDTTTHAEQVNIWLSGDGVGQE